MRVNKKLQEYSAFNMPKVFIHSSFTFLICHTEFAVNIAGISFSLRDQTTFIAASTCCNSVKRFIIHCTYIWYSFRCAQKACCIVCPSPACLSRLSHSPIPTQHQHEPQGSLSCSGRSVAMPGKSRDEMWPMWMRVALARIMLNIFVGIVVAVVVVVACEAFSAWVVVDLIQGAMHFTVECSYEKCTAIRTRTSAHLCCYPFYQLHCCWSSGAALGDWGIAPSPAALGPTMDSLFVAVFRCFCSYCWCCCGYCCCCRRRRYKWHCNIISVENTSKCNPALHVFVRQPGTRWVGTHTHAQLLWLVSICVYICACICWHPPSNTQTLAGTHAHWHPSLLACVCLCHHRFEWSLSQCVCVCGVCALALFFMADDLARRICVYSATFAVCRFSRTFQPHL